MFGHCEKGQYLVYNEINGVNNERSAGILLHLCFIRSISKPEDVN